MWLLGWYENVICSFTALLVLKVDSTMYTTSQYSINHSVCVLRYVFSILLQRVKALSQSIHCNDPLRKYLNTIIKVFSPELQSEFNSGRDDYEDFKPTEDVLSKGSLESLYKKTTKVVRLSRSSRMWEHSLTNQLTHSLTHTLTYPHTHSFTHSHTHLLSHPLTHSHTHSLTHSLTYSLTCSVTHSLARPLSHILTHLLSYSLSLFL